MRNIDFNKYQSALIIGNGFDLSLGLSTSYMDFVNSDEFQILLNMQNQLAIYLKVNAELQNWIDIENELKLYSKNEDNAKFKTEYEALCKQLVVYINNIDYSSINKNSKAYEVLTNLSSTKNNIILDFNYTASTRLILKQCGLSDEDIDNRLIKVHGEASNNDIIFGVEDWKIQCKLPPKTKRFCPLKTFNNAPLKSLDRWGYYYFSLFPSVCRHLPDTFSV